MTGLIEFLLYWNGVLLAVAINLHVFLECMQKDAALRSEVRVQAVRRRYTLRLAQPVEPEQLASS